jgi:hypothetical protein
MSVGARINVRPAQNPDRQLGSPASRSQYMESNGRECTSLQWRITMRLLIAEDDTDLRQVMSALL